MKIAVFSFIENKHNKLIFVDFNNYMIQLDNILKVDQNETQQMVIDSAQDFSEQYIRPIYMEWDEAQYFPLEVLRKAGSLGFMGVLIPEIYGGAGMGYQEYISIIIEISKVDPSIGLSHSGTQFLSY